MDIIALYHKYIYDRYNSLVKSGKEEFDNKDLSKIFEYYSAIKLSEQYGQLFYEYNDIDPNFKEFNQMSKNDSGVDLCNLVDTIVQCKLRKQYLNWGECSTFFASQNIFNDGTNSIEIKWKNLIIARNSDCKLSCNLSIKNKLFTDITYDRDELLSYCSLLTPTCIGKTPLEEIEIKKEINLRDYQIECIELIRSNKNVIIQLPTGCGKNVIITNYIRCHYNIKNGENTKSLKFLILVPKIILMEQIRDEFTDLNVLDNIQLIGDGNNEFNSDKLITICVYNSIDKIDNFAQFEKIFIDEAHHIIKPEIYYNEDDTNSEYNSDDEEYTSDYEEDGEDNEEDGEDDYMSENKDECKIENIKEENYLTKIRKLKKYNNNVFLSATIDKIDEYEYYSKDIRDMINAGYLCDYNIHIPIFSGNIDTIKNDINVCRHIIQNYRNIIIYCNTKEEGIEINRIMNDLLPLCSNYVDCDTKRNERKTILEQFKSGEIPFLVNVKILVEGVNFPITKGVLFLHLPSSKTAIIQIIGRALRLHDQKTIANVILPFSSSEDEKTINNFLRILANNDERIKQSYDRKKLGGYISLNKVEEDCPEEGSGSDTLNNCEFRFTMIYDNIGKLINSEEIWMQKLEEVKAYIDEFGHRPSSSKLTKNKKELSMSNWIRSQNYIYKNNIGIMKIENIKQIWKNFIGEYKQYFLNSEEIWIQKLEKLKDYINNFKKIPSNKSKSGEDAIMGRWKQMQSKLYIKEIQIMKNKDIRKLWEAFMHEYRQYFLSNEEQWELNLYNVRQFFINNNRRPKPKNADEKIMATWINTQAQQYKNNNFIMKNIEIKKMWGYFIEEFKQYFETNEEIWLKNLHQADIFINTNGKRPSTHSKNKEEQSLGAWINTQLSENYKKNRNILKNEDLKKMWEDFLELHKHHFMSNEEIWKIQFEKCKKYIDNFGKKPSRHSSDIEEKNISQWLSCQQKKYKKNIQCMQNKDIKKIWENFLEEYKQYFISNEDMWKINFEKCKKYIDDYDKRPPETSKIKTIGYLGKWLSHQNTNYKQKKDIMKNAEIYNVFTDFLNDKKHKQYFK